MFENVQFLHLHSRFEKSATVIGPNFFFNNLEIKNAEFYVNFKFVDADFKKVPRKLIRKKPRTNVQKRNYSKFTHFFGYNFFKSIFLSRHEQI